MSVIQLYKTETQPVIEIAKKEHQSDVAAHGHGNFYEIEFVISGGGYCRLNEMEYQAKPGAMFLSTPYDIHSVKNSNACIYCLSFDESSIVPEYQNILFNTKIRYAQFENIHKIITLFELLMKEAENKKDHFTLNNEKNLVNLIIAEFIRTAEIDSNSVPITLIQDIVRYVRIYACEPITLESVSKTFNISSSHLSRLFKKHIGENFKQYLINLRLDRAKTLLSQTEMSVTNVCFETGFLNVGNFLRRFKEEFGVTPNKYRENYKKRGD